MHRRTLVANLLLGPIGLATVRRAMADVPGGSADLEELRNAWRELLAPDARIATASDPVERSNDEWSKVLEAAQYQVLRREGTERPFTSPLNDEKRAGVFVCVACDLPVFTSAMKFDSGTGWPSFFTTVPGAFKTKRDFALIWPRTEYHCARCGGHHGHVFNDGPAPTHQRWCNNGVALRFIPKDG